MLACFLTVLTARGADVDPILRLGLPFRDLTVTVPKLKKPPTIDGTVDPNEWADAGMAPRLITARDDGDDRLTDLEGRFYFGYTDDSFYLAFQIQRPAGAIEPLAMTEKSERDKSMWKSNDFLELFLDNIPNIGRPPASYRDYYFTWNLKGSRYDRTEYPIMNRGWNPEWETVSRVVPGYGWEGECRWPLKIFDKLAGVPKAGDVWRYSLFANNATPKPSNDFSSFSLQWSSSRDFSAMRFTGDDGLVVRVLDSGAMRKTHDGGLVLELFNPTAKEQTASADIRIYRRRDNAPSKVSYLRAFDQSRDRPEDLVGKGKVATFLSDEQTSELLLKENYDLVKQTKREVTLAAGKREKIDALVDASPGHYLILYEVHEGASNPAAKDRPLLAGAALPFVVPEPLEVKTENYTLVDRSISVQAELQYINDWKGQGTIEARVVSAAAADKPLFEKTWDAKGLEEMLRFNVPTKDLAAGDYRLKIVAKDPSGKTLATRDASLVVPPVPKWFTDKAGMEPTIPPPWTPIEASDQKVSVLMGDYELRDSLLPAQINVQSIYKKERKPLLRAPMRLVAKLNGKEVQLVAQTKLGQAKPEQVDCSAEAQAEGLTFTNQTSFEYDGMGKATLSIAPTAGATASAVDELYLEVPLHKEFSTLCTGFGGQVYEVPADGAKIPFTECVTIGNEERRFVWFAESQRGWRVAPKFAKEAIELINSADDATLRINFVKTDAGKPLAIDKPREIVFGFMFTPARTMPKGPMNAIYFGGNPDREAKECLVNVFERWDFYTGVQGWPEFKTPDIRGKSTADVIKSHELGTRMTPYTGWFIHRAATIYPIYGDEMLNDPIVDGGVGCDVVCWNTPVQDAMSSLLTDRANDTKIDGYRLDAGFQSLYKCQSLKHHGYGSVCGWYDDDGKLQGSMPIFAARRMSQRGYRIFHGGTINDGLCLQWQSAARLPPVMSHMDSCGSCEGPDTHIRAIKEIPFAYYRSIVMADALGVNCVYMPKADVIGMDTRLGNALIHNVTPRGAPNMSNMDSGYSRSAGSPLCVWQIRGRGAWIDPYAEGSEFFGYWKNSKLVQTDSEDRKASLYVRRGEKILLAVLNLERKPVESVVKLNLADLGFKESFAQDAVTGDDLPMEQGTLKLDFTAEGFRAVKIAPTKQASPVPQRAGENIISEMEPSKWPAAGLPAGWSGQRAGAAVDDGQLVLSPGTLLTRAIKVDAGKSYVLELDVRVQCDDGAFLGEQINAHVFRVSLGGNGRYGRASWSSQSVPGRYQTLRALWTAPTADSPEAAVEISFGGGKGKVLVKRIELFPVAPS